MGNSFLFIHTLSPNTAFEDQCLVDFGFLKALGFSQVHNNTIPIGIKLYHSNHTRLQIAIAKSGKMMNRVQTLHGLECCIQVLSSSLKKSLTFFSMLITIKVKPKLANFD